MSSRGAVRIDQALAGLPAELTVPVLIELRRLWAGSRVYVSWRAVNYRDGDDPYSAAERLARDLRSILGERGKGDAAARRLADEVMLGLQGYYVML